MPESPEVAALVAHLDETLAGCRVAAIDVLEFRAWKTRARPPASLAGAAIAAARRFGKHVVLDTGRGAIVISLGRAGWMRLRAPGEEAPEGQAPAIVRFALDDGRVLEATDAGEWLSIGVHAIDAPEDVPALAGLGADPLAPTWDRDAFDRALGARRKRLKPLLQEQESIAGIGNAYSDEILHTARLSPFAHAADLSPAERDRLFAAIGEVVVGAAHARRGIPIADQKAAKLASMRVHGRTGAGCPVCGGIVEDVPGSKGAAQYCPTCQTGAVPLSG